MNFSLPLDQEEQKLLSGYMGKEIVLGVRPENIVEGSAVALQVTNNENLGMNTLVHGLLQNGAGITCKLRGWCDYKAGDSVRVDFVKRHFFDKESTNAIR